MPDRPSTYVPGTAPRPSHGDGHPVEREGAWSAPGTRTRSSWGTGPGPAEQPRFRCVLRGDLDFPARDRLLEIAEAFEASVCPTAEVDVAEVTFVDSSALALLFAMRRTATERGGEVILLNPGRRLRRLLAVAGVSELFAVDPLRSL